MDSIFDMTVSRVEADNFDSILLRKYLFRGDFETAKTVIFVSMA
jgi:hypothetical protein